MINQQLLEYIRQQLAAGVAKEEVKKALATQGWNEQDINEGFATLEKPQAPTQAVPPRVPAPVQMPGVAQAKIVSEVSVSQASSTGVENKIWSKGIPRTNVGFMVVSLLLVFGLDLVILLNSPGLAPYFIVMLVVLGIFGVFYYIENYVFKKKYSNSQSKLDAWISVLAVLRNLVFVLNFIPFIQILGGVALVFGGIPYLILYGILLSFRSKATHAS